MKLIFNRIIKQCVIVLVMILVWGCKTDTNKLAFIGDSIVAGWDIEYYFPMMDVLNYGKYGAKVVDVKNLSTQIPKVNVAIVLIGINNLNVVIDENELDSTIDNLIDSYKEAVLNIKVERIIIVSVLPIYEENTLKSHTINSQLQEMNAKLENAFLGSMNVKFLDVNDLFKDISGQLDMNYSADGIHLNAYGYQLLSSKLSSLL